MSLGPGEGYWLPADGIVLDGYTASQTEMQVMLVMRSQA
jgi:hypothetical protein